MVSLYFEARCYRTKTDVCTDLRSTADSIADLDGLDILSDFDSSSNDFVADAKRQGDISPSSGDCYWMSVLRSSTQRGVANDTVKVGCANAYQWSALSNTICKVMHIFTTGVNGNVNVTIFECLELEFALLEGGPLLRVVDHEALGGLWVRHDGGVWLSMC